VFTSELLPAGRELTWRLPIWGYFYKKVLADPTLGITEQQEFIRPLDFSVNMNCGDEEERDSSSDYYEFF
jgi:penicillin-binding protein 1A